MTDYTNNFNGDTKDSGNDIILGVDFDTEFDSLVTHIATKANKVGSATVDRIVTMTSSGDMKDSTKLITDKADVAGDTYTGVYDGNDTTDSTTGGTGSIHTEGGIGAVKEIVTDATFKPLGDTSSSDLAAVGYDTTNGAILTGQGSTFDVVLKNDADAVALGVTTGTVDLVAKGAITCGGNVFSDTDSTDDLGTTGARWKELFIDTITITDFDSPRSITKYKTADESRSSTTTPTDDNHLVAWTLDAGSYYNIDGYLMLSAGTTGTGMGLKFQLSQTPVGSSWAATSIIQQISHWNNVETAISHVQSNNQNSAITPQGYIITHATLSTTMDFQWSQETSNANASILRKGSWIRITKMS